MIWDTVKLSTWAHPKQNKHPEIGLSMILKLLINQAEEHMDKYFQLDKEKANLYVY